MAADRIWWSSTVMRRSRYALGLGAALICGLAAPARAEVHVEGSPSAVRISTGQDAIADVLSAVATTFNVRYRTARRLGAAVAAEVRSSSNPIRASTSVSIRRDDDAAID